MAAPKHNIPTYRGLYISSFKKGSFNSSTYETLLGSDGYGSYVGGNKIDELFQYMDDYDYNYGLFYSLGGSALTGSNKEQFLTEGFNILHNVLQRAFNKGLIYRGAVCSVFRAANTATTGFRLYDGLSDVKKIVHYNSTAPTDQKFNWLNFGDEEPWKFDYTGTTLSGTVRIISGQTGVLEFPDFPSNTRFLNDFEVGDFIYVGNEWRQVVTLTDDNFLEVDRPWSSSNPGTSTSANIYRRSNDGQVDYETYLYRIGKVYQYLVSVGQDALLPIDLYQGFPDTVFTNGTVVTQQLDKLYRAGVTRINLTNYNTIPNFGYLDGSAGRITNDIVKSKVVRKVGSIISAESATLNNDTVCPTKKTNNNFAGYFLEGRSKSPAGTADFKALDSGGNVIICNCCTPAIFAPVLGTYSPRSFQDCWNYTVTNILGTNTGSGSAPSTASPKCALKSLTYDGVINAAGASAFDLNNYIEMECQIMFSQKIVRQLITSSTIPPNLLHITESHTNSGCYNTSTGSIYVSATGGSLDYDFFWEKYNGATYNPFTPTDIDKRYSTDLEPTNYRITVDDGVTTDVIIVTITEETVLDISSYSITNTNCSGINGSITNIVGMGGLGTYVYSCQLLGDPPIWVGTNNFTDLNPIEYTICVANSNNLNCYSCETVELSETAAPTITAVIDEAIPCNGDYGSIVAERVTGTYPFVYTIKNKDTNVVFQTSPPVSSNWTFFNIYKNTLGYNIQATSADGCLSNIVVREMNTVLPMSLTIDITPPLCYLGLTGDIEIDIANGTAPYDYYLTSDTISKSAINDDSNHVFSNLPVDTYSLFIRDANDCTYTQSGIILPNADELTAEFIVTQIPQGETTGGRIQMTYVSAAVTYLWENGSTASDRLNLDPGTYTVVITNNNGCSITKVFYLTIDCDTLSLTSIKTTLFKLQCCSGKLAKKYVKLIQQGREDLANCLVSDLQFLTMASHVLCRITNAGAEYNLICIELQNIIDQIAKICDCECNEDDVTEIDVIYNPDTNKFNLD